MTIMSRQNGSHIGREDDLATNIGKSNLVFYLV